MSLCWQHWQKILWRKGAGSAFMKDGVRDHNSQPRPANNNGWLLDWLIGWLGHFLLGRLTDSLSGWPDDWLFLDTGSDFVEANIKWSQPHSRGIHTKEIHSNPILKYMHTSCTLKWLKFSQNQIASTFPCFLTTHTVAKFVSHPPSWKLKTIENSA